MTELNDDLLVAYVEGQLAKDQSKAVERVLQEDEVAAQRVEALRAASSHLEAAFEAMLAGEPIPLPADGKATASHGRSRIARLVLRAGLTAWVGLGCLLGGAAAGFIFYDQIAAEPFETAAAAAPPPAVKMPAPPAPVPATWAEDVARTHALLSPETFSFGLESEGNMELAGFHLSKALGADFEVPDLSGQNLIFHRAQLLQRQGKPFAQIAYMSESGIPVALYATAHKGEPETLSLDEKDGIGLASWTQAGLSLLLAGDLPETRLQTLAAAIESRFAAAEPGAQDTGTPVKPTITEPGEQAYTSGAARKSPAPTTTEKTEQTGTSGADEITLEPR